MTIKSGVIKGDMKKKELIAIIQRLLKTDTDIRFLDRLTESELETLIACIRERVDNKPN